MQGSSKKIILPILLFQAALFCAYGQENKFKIGISLPLTGSLAEYGEAVRNGISLAKEDNPRGFDDIELIFEDDGYSAQKALGNYQKLVKTHKVNLFYVWGTEVAIAISQVAEKDRTAALLGCLDPVCSKSREYSIRLFPDYSALASQYEKRDLFKNAAAIKAESSFFNGQIDYLNKNAADKFRLAETVLPADNDLNTVVLKIKEQQFDMLGIYLFVPQIKILLNALKGYQLKPKIFSTTPMFNKSLIREYKDQLQDAYISHFNISQEFVAKYAARFGKDEQAVYAGAAYANAMLLSEVFGAADSRHYGMALISRLRDSLQHPRSSPNGEYSLQYQKDNGWFLNIPTALYQVKGEDILKIE